MLSGCNERMGGPNLCLVKGIGRSVACWQSVTKGWKVGDMSGRG